MPTVGELQQQIRATKDEKRALEMEKIQLIQAAHVETEEELQASLDVLTAEKEALQVEVDALKNPA